MTRRIAGRAPLRLLYRRMLRSRSWSSFDNSVDGRWYTVDGRRLIHSVLAYTFAHAGDGRQGPHGGRRARGGGSAGGRRRGAHRMGTDSGVEPRGNNLEELRLRVECGMTRGAAGRDGVGGLTVRRRR
jgi:hypothetical protein